MQALNKLMDTKDEVIENIELLIQMVSDNTELIAERDHLVQELGVMVGMMNDMIAENAHRAQDQTEYQKRYDALDARYDGANAKYEKACNDLEEKQAQMEILWNELEMLKQQAGTVTEFDEGLWEALVDYVTVYSREDVRFTFKHGVDIKI